jgi:hypothetical protein
MQEIRVLFEADGDDAFRAQLTDAGGLPIGVACPFTPPLDDADYDSLRWYLEEFMDLPDGGAVVRAQQVEKQLDGWSRRLFDAIFGPAENGQVLRQLLAAPEPRQLTIATDKSVLLRLPWELMADDAGSLAQRVSVRRQLAKPEDTTTSGEKRVEQLSQLLGNRNKWDTCSAGRVSAAAAVWVPRPRAGTV